MTGPGPEEPGQQQQPGRDSSDLKISAPVLTRADLETDQYRQYASVLSEALWICETPHPSGAEAELVEKIRQRALDAGFQVMVDEAGNIAIERPGRGAGKDVTEGVILQGHLDMVPDVVGLSGADNIEQYARTHPVELMIRDQELSDGRTVEVLCGKGSSFGDCLIGSSVAMETLFGDTVVDSPPVRVLFTVQEEVGLGGAMRLDPKMLAPWENGAAQSFSGLLNLDIGNPDAIRIGGAGSSDMYARWQPEREEVNTEKEIPVRVSLCDLAGGHSGLNIHQGGANAIKELIQALASEELNIAQYGVRLANLSGGNARGSIATECEAIFWCPKERVTEFREAIFGLGRRWSQLSEGIDKNLTVRFNELQHADENKYVDATVRGTEWYKRLVAVRDPISIEDSTRLLRNMAQIPFGVKEWYRDEDINFDLTPGMERPPYTSTNIGTLMTVADQHGTFQFQIMTRSDGSEDTRKYENEIAEIIKSEGGEVEHLDDLYTPAWDPDPNIRETPFFKAQVNAHIEERGKKPIVFRQHSGLEVGILSNKPEGEEGEEGKIDASAIGAHIEGHHKADQWVTLESTGSLQRRVHGTLRNLTVPQEAQ